MMATAASIVVGGAMVTGGSMVMDGRVYSSSELAMESTINIGTFAVGGMLFKVGRGISTAEKMGKTSKLVATIGTESGGMYVMGIGSDYLRSTYHDAGFSLSESAIHNIFWALIPLAARAA
jgi:hypothetical protein